MWFSKSLGNLLKWNLYFFTFDLIDWSIQPKHFCRHLTVLNPSSITNLSDVMKANLASTCINKVDYVGTISNWCADTFLLLLDRSTWRSICAPIIGASVLWFLNTFLHKFYYFRSYIAKFVNVSFGHPMPKQF